MSQLTLISGLVVGASILAGGGLLVAFWAWFGRLVDRDPHCRRCRYNLTGLPREQPSARCPECGRSLAQRRAVRMGLRRVRRGALVAGMLCVLIGGTGIGFYLAGRARGIDWYQFYPDALVIQDLCHPSLAQRDRAVAEITRRLTMSTFSVTQLRPLIPRALAAQTAATPDPAGPALMFAMDWLEVSGALTPEETDQYLGNLVRLELQTRNPVCAGERFDLELRALQRGPAHRHSWRALPKQLTLDGQKAEVNRFLDPHGDVTYGVDTRTTVSEARLFQPGLHTAELSVTLQLDPYHNRNNGPARETTVVLRQDIVIVPPEAADPLSLVDRPELGAAVARGFRLMELRHAANRTFLTFSYPHPRPAALAFDVLLVTRAGTWSCDGVVFDTRPSSATEQRLTLADLRDWEPLTIVLRTSRERTRGAALEGPVWDGELRFADVTDKTSNLRPQVGQRQRDAAADEAPPQEGLSAIPPAMRSGVMARLRERGLQTGDLALLDSLTAPPRPLNEHIAWDDAQTDVQRNELLARWARIELLVPFVTAGRPFAPGFYIDTRAMPQRYRLQAEVVEASVGDIPLFDFERPIHVPASRPPLEAYTGQPIIVGPGTYPLRFVLSLSLYNADPVQARTGTGPVFTTRREVSGSLSVNGAP